MLRVVTDMASIIVNIGVSSKVEVLSLDTMKKLENSNSNLCNVMWNNDYYVIEMPDSIPGAKMHISKDTPEGKHITELIDWKSSENKINDYLISLFFNRNTEQNMLLLLKNSYQRGFSIGQVTPHNFRHD